MPIKCKVNMHVNNKKCSSLLQNPISSLLQSVCAKVNKIVFWQRFYFDIFYIVQTSVTGRGCLPHRTGLTTFSVLLRGCLLLPKTIQTLDGRRKELSSLKKIQQTSYVTIYTKSQARANQHNSNVSPRMYYNNWIPDPKMAPIQSNKNCSPGA